MSTNPQQPSPDKTQPQPLPSRGTGWLWPLLVGLLLGVLVTCGVIRVLNGGMGLFSRGTGTDPQHTDQDGLVSRDKDKVATDAPKNGTDGPKPKPNLGTDGLKLPSSLLVDLGGSVKMKFVLIDPKSNPDGGKFKMGSPPDEKGRNPDEKAFDAEKQHDVELTKRYYLAKYPVTRAQHLQVMSKNPSNFKDDSGRLPVEGVSWDDAQDFCQEMTKQGGDQLPAALRQSKPRFMLPTEAQWEYACRAGTKTAYYFGDDPADLGDYAWFSGNSERRTHPVGEKKPNGWGLYDMHGNVWQWCEDYYAAEYYANSPIKDPFNSKKPDYVVRVQRGGSWSSLTDCRAATRFWQAPENRNSNPTGFRVCLPLD